MPPSVNPPAPAAKKPWLTSQQVHALLVLFATLVCLFFASTLKDTSLVQLYIQQVAAPPVPQEVGDRDGKLSVSVKTQDQAPLAHARVTILWIRDGLAYLASFAETPATGIVAFDKLPRGHIWVLADASGHARVSTHLMLTAEPKAVDLTSPVANELALKVQGDDDKPIAQAKVLVHCDDPLPFLGQTDAQGDVRIGRLCAPPYTVEASADGYEKVSRSSIYPSDPPTILTLRRLGTLEVRVQLETGEPAPLANVYVAGPGVWPARQTQTNAFGRTIITGLPEGSYDARAVRANFVSPITSGVEVRFGEQAKLTLTLQQGHMVMVNVTDGDSPEAPGVPNAGVVLVEGGISSFPLEGQTGVDGKVQLGPVPAGPLSASARAEGFMSTGVVSVPPDAELVRIPLLKGGRLVGDVVDARGFPVLGASLEVVGTDLTGQPVDETPATQAFRQAHFRWALPGPPQLVPAGELGVMPGPIPPIPRGNAPMAATTTPQPTPAASGLIVAPANIPPPTNDPSVPPPEPWVTNSQGDFSIGPIPPGHVSVIVRHPEYIETISEAVSLQPGGEARLHVVLQSGGTLEGTVRDDRRFPIPGALVQVVALQGTFERSTVTDSNGAFSFSAVSPDLAITVMRPDSDELGYEGKLKVEPGKRRTVDIVLHGQRDPVAVRVTDDRGYPVDTAQVTALSLNPEVSLRKTAFTTADGQAAIQDAVGLPIRFEVFAPGHAPVVKIVEQTPKELAIQLSQGVRLRGKVTGRGGRDNVEGAQVRLYLESGIRHLITAADGSFSVADIGPGPLHLRVDHPDHVAVEKTVEIKAPSNTDRPVELDPIDMAPGGTAEGEVVDERGDPVVGARIAKDEVPTYLPYGPLPPGIVATNTKGEFKLSGLPEGDNIVLEAYAPGIGRGKIERVSIRAERSTTRIRITIKATQDKSPPALVSGVPVSLREVSIPAGKAAEVVDVPNGSQAERAGLIPGDRITSIDGATVTSLADAQKRLAGPEHQEVVLDVLRGERSLKVRVIRERMRQ